MMGDVARLDFDPENPSGPRPLYTEIDPLTGVPLQPSEQAQGKFGRIADAVVGGLRNWIETPGRAMREGINTEEAVNWGAPTAFGMLGVGAPNAMIGGIPRGAIGAAGGRGKMGGVVADPVDRYVRPQTTVASPEEITRAAAESAKGITQPALRQLYGDLGLTGQLPSEFVSPSLAAQQSAAARQAAIDLKMADRRVLDTLTDAERKAFAAKGQLPAGKMLPSQEAAAPALAEYAPIKKEVAKAEKAFDKDVARGIKPSVFNLTPEVLNVTPDVAQFPLPRVAPEITERLKPATSGGLRRVERAAAAAPEENWGWYNLMQQRDALHAKYGPRQGEQVWNAWLDSVAGTSMVNPIDNNIRSSTWYLQQMLEGKALPEVLVVPDPVSGKPVQVLVGGPPPGYGAKSQTQHAARVRDYVTNEYDPVANPKPISYRQNLGGNWMPRTVDTHDIRNMLGMPYAKEAFNEKTPAILPKEYSYLEQLGQRAADRAGTPQAPQQAATWVGGGDYTNLKSYPAPLLEALNRRAQVTGMVRGHKAETALDKAFSKRGLPLLAVPPAAVMGTVAASDRYEQ